MSNATPQSNARAKAHALSDAAGTAALALLALLALPLLWSAAARLLALLRYPYPHDGLEGTLLHEARLLWAGDQLYQPLTRSRFVSAPYPPLHPLLLGLADNIAGPHVFWGGRLLSLTAALGVAALIVLIVRRAGGTWLGGLLGMSLFLSAPPVLLWATRVKPDLTALLWTALGLYLAVHLTTDEHSEPRTKNREPVVWRWFSVLGSWFSPWFWVALCFVLAFFTKQTDVMAPLGTGLALLIGDLRAFYGAGKRAGYIGRLPMRWRTLIYGLSYFALALGIWALLDLMTAGQYTAHVWGLHRSEWWSAALLGKFVALLMPYLPAIVLALLVLIRAVQTRRALIPACYALVVPISLLGAGETGANHNHLLEYLLALALSTGIAAGCVAELLRSANVPTGRSSGISANWRPMTRPPATSPSSARPPARCWPTMWGCCTQPVGRYATMIHRLWGRQQSAACGISVACSRRSPSAASARSYCPSTSIAAVSMRPAAGRPRCWRLSTGIINWRSATRFLRMFRVSE